MLCRCLYANCNASFEVAEEKVFRAGSCPSCSRPMTARPLAVMDQMQRQEKRLAETGKSFIPSKDTPTFAAIVEDVRSLWNVGSIFRTADGAGIDHLYLCGITGCPPEKEIEKTSLGAQDCVNWSYAASAMPIIDHLKKKQVQIIGLERTPNSNSLAKAIDDGKTKSPFCLIVGNEVSGLSSETIAACDLVLDLPMSGVKESLNVAVAFGIASYLLKQQLFQQ